MASDTLAEVVARMSRDAAFRKAVYTDPLQALAGYALTEAEKQALASSAVDPDISVDQRTTKRKSIYLPPP